MLGIFWSGKPSTSSPTPEIIQNLEIGLPGAAILRDLTGKVRAVAPQLREVDDAIW